MWWSEPVEVKQVKESRNKKRMQGVDFDKKEKPIIFLAWKMCRWELWCCWFKICGSREREREWKNVENK